jgi:hypothetical protein
MKTSVTTVRAWLREWIGPIVVLIWIVVLLWWVRIPS